MKRLILISYRNFKRKPVIRLINIIGLALSLAMVIILSAYCYSELTVDSHHIDGEKVFLVSNSKEKDTYGAILPGILKPQIDLQISEVKSSVRVRKSYIPPVVQVDDREPVESELLYVDSNFFDLFTYKTIYGNLESALQSPMSLVLVESEAIKLFGTAKVVGQKVKINNELFFTVAAVVENLREKSSLEIRALSSMESLKNMKRDYSKGDFNNWGQRNFLTFVKLNDSKDFKATANAINNLFPEEYRKSYKLNLVPIKQVYLTKCGVNSSFLSYIHQGDKSQVILMLLMAFVVLLVALINFLNITVSSASEKLKHSCIHRMIGANRLNVASGILVNVLITFIVATVLSALVVIFVSPYLKNYTGIGFNQTFPLGVYALGMFCILLLGFMSGIIPALKFSSEKSIKTERGVSNVSLVGKGLLVFQFLIAIAFLAFTFLVQKQVKFGGSTLGYNKNNIVAIKINEALLRKQEVLKNQLQNQANIGNVSFSQFYPGKVRLNHNRGQFQHSEGNKIVPIKSMNVDKYFVSTMGLELLQGRNFRNDFADKNNVIVNEAFIKENKLSENVIGAKLLIGRTAVEIVGVVKDFHFESIHKSISPIVLTNRKTEHLFVPLYCLFEINGSNLDGAEQVFAKTKEIGETLSSGMPVEISFIDQGVQRMYLSEVQFKRAFTLFAVSAIIICCMGIFALSLIAAQNRIKEIGVRKVNGARVMEILTMLNKDFVMCVVIAFVFACPIAYYAMSKWLENFAYKTTLSWWIFALSGILALGIALLTVSWQSWRAATRNPVEALRYE